MTSDVAVRRRLAELYRDIDPAAAYRRFTYGPEPSGRWWGLRR